MVPKLLLKINFRVEAAWKLRVEITIFTQCDEVVKQ